MILFYIFSLIIIFIVGCIPVSKYNKTIYEKKLEDEEQMQYIQKYNLEKLH